MKAMKKLASLLLALALVFSLGLTAFADDEDLDGGMTVDTATISVEDNRTYEVYQIFTGKLYNGKLTHVLWGTNAVLPEGAKVGDEVEESLLDTLEGNAGDSVIINRISPYVNFRSDPCGTVSKENPVTVSVGYYLLKDITVLDDGEEYSRYVIQLVGDINVKPKADAVTSTKKVKERNDSTNHTSQWQDAADYDIGDEVPFSLKGVVSGTYDYYESYTFIFHDKLSAGLTFDSTTVQVRVGDAPISSGYEVVTECEDGCTFHIVIENLKVIPAVEANSRIYVDYKAILNENAVLGSAGNPNEMYLEYSNNPAEPDSTGETVEDKVTVFTYKLEVNKVDEAGQALKGAGFTLYKEIHSGTEIQEVAIGEEVKGNDMTAFTWKGLDDGTYVLKETTPPNGYNPIDPLKFVITATYQIESDNPQLTGLTGGTLGTGDIATGVITTNVENRAGATLPTTGGMGTTLIYAVGGILVLAAVVLLVTKKRMSDAE